MEIYDYLERAYSANVQHQENYDDLDDFMSCWLKDNFASEAIYEEFIDGDFIGYHQRSFKIDHNNRTIIFLLDEDVW